MIHLQAFIFNPFQENTFLLYDHSGKCIIIDPGMYSQEEENQITGCISSLGLIPEAIVVTHGHIDHILGCRFMVARYNIPFYIHSDDVVHLKNVAQYGIFFGLEVEMPPDPDHFLNPGETFSFGESSLHILHVPGHSGGSIALYSQEGGFVITGDALFDGSIGRTDLPGGDFQTLTDSIRTRLMCLPRETTVYPGHGPSTTIGREYDTNPFLN